MSLSINEIIKNKRIFEVDDDCNYFILDENKIKKCMCFDYVIAIKHGDLPYPKKWLRFFDMEHPINGQAVPIEEYNSDEYEYVFMPDFHFPDELKKPLEELGYTRGRGYKAENFLIELDEIPEQLLPIVKDMIIENQKHTSGPEQNDFYVYEKDGESVYFLVGREEGFINTITDEVTTKFQDIKTLEVYETPSKDTYLFKTKDPLSSYSSERWFVYLTADPNFPCLKEVDEVADMLPYTSFKVTEPKVEVK